ncbi:hypothetical protein BaRGS_00003689 [Batillaria attramentaria]|uniref:Nuclease HARBI1 n=1 Tax=Batillaria attramentaria TaxID=370345 RepID=A0ABD0M1D9_9CAEN
MAAAIAFAFYQRRQRQRLSIFRDRTHPLEVYDDSNVYKKFRFSRRAILELTAEIEHELEYPARRTGALTPVLQVLLTLRYYATGTFQNTVGDLSHRCRPKYG